MLLVNYNTNRTSQQTNLLIFTQPKLTVVVRSDWALQCQHVDITPSQIHKTTEKQRQCSSFWIPIGTLMKLSSKSRVCKYIQKYFALKQYRKWKHCFTTLLLKLKVLRIRGKRRNSLTATQKVSWSTILEYKKTFILTHTDKLQVHGVCAITIIMCSWVVCALKFTHTFSTREFFC